MSVSLLEQARPFTQVPNATPSPDPVIRVRSLSKTYDRRKVLDDVSFDLLPGQVLGVLGPNGAGKTTLLETIEGLRRIQNGTVEVLGRDMRRDYKSVQRSLGIQLQKTSLFRNLTVRETIRLYGALYGTPPADIGAVLDRFDLRGRSNALVRKLSGGQFQRFSLCLATLNRPRILFLDEPTTGLDPLARRALWGIIASLRGTGTSIVLTTHYMEEAQSVCDDVLILNQGKVVAHGSPASLIGALRTERTLIIEPEPGQPIDALLPHVAHLSPQVRDGRIYLYGADAHGLVAAALDGMAGAGARVADIHLRAPSLDDVFIAYAGPAGTEPQNAQRNRNWPGVPPNVPSGPAQRLLYAVLQRFLARRAGKNGRGPIQPPRPNRGG